MKLGVLRRVRNGCPSAGHRSAHRFPFCMWGGIGGCVMTLRFKILVRLFSIIPVVFSFRHFNFLVYMNYFRCTRGMC